jgi:hypothetical protein
MALESQGTYLEIAGTAGDPVLTLDPTAGNPTFITKVSHGLSNGDVVTLSAFAGTASDLLNGKTAIVRYVTDDTFVIGIDTSSGTLTASTGTATPLNWVEVGEVTDINREDPGAAEIDTTHLRSTSKEYLMGLQDPGTLTMTVNFLFDDTGQNLLHTAKADRVARDFRVTYPSTDVMTFSGLVQTFNGPGASVDDKLVGNVTLRVTGDVEFV